MRSGSTLLGILLGMQPKITYLGEGRNFHEYFIKKKSCSCGCTLYQCPFWSSVIKKFDVDVMKLQTKTENNLSHKFVKYISIFNLLLKVIKKAGIFSNLTIKEFEVIENISKIYDLVSIQSASTVICDSSHRNTQAKLSWLYFRKKFKLIHLVRDGRGVTNSVMKRNVIPMKKAAKAWRRNNFFSLITQLGIPKKNILRIRYEDLCNDPHYMIKKACNFAGVKYIKNDFLSNQGNLHFIGGSSTIRQNLSGYLQIKVDEKWKSELSIEDKSNFNMIAGRINRLYGYK